MRRIREVVMIRYQLATDVIDADGIFLWQREP